ncbi:MAG: hypothetical protein A2X23_13055 [Chloroflexi bacterium GWC2_73_18]|nr:MAG: hypothetical protein A2X23_13055 [Chloroflexi bacterium GWC2_73_18]
MAVAEPPVPGNEQPVGLARWPGVRAFRSPRFRIVLAGVLWAAGAAVIVSFLARQAADPAGQYGVDFADYRTASLRMLEGRSPYAPEMLVAPVPAHGLDRYRYPPPFAQLLTPLAVQAPALGVTLWAAVQAFLVLAATWIAGGVGGGRPTLERFLWSGVAATFYLPVFDTLWKGNVDGLLAFLVALVLRGGMAGGAAIAAAGWLKVSPTVLLAAGARGGHRFLAGVALATGVILVPSLLLVPGAWADYARVLPNLMAGPAIDPVNLAPASLLATAGADPRIVDAVRGLTVTAGLAAAGLALWLAGGPAGWRGAVVCAVVAVLLLPAALWYHYLVLLLPIAALAWPAAGTIRRVGLMAGLGAIPVGLAFLPLADVGAVVAIASAVGALWPGRAVALRSKRTA